MKKLLDLTWNEQKKRRLFDPNADMFQFPAAAGK